MRFDVWLDANRERIPEMAKFFDVTPAAIYQWRKSVPVDRMRGVVLFTRGAVKLDDMVPPAKVSIGAAPLIKMAPSGFQDSRSGEERRQGPLVLDPDRRTVADRRRLFKAERS